MKENTVASINLAVVGAKDCGKSALTVRYLTRRFIGEYDSEKDNIITRKVHVAGKETEVIIRDTAEVDWLKSPQTLIGWSTAIVVVYSITNQSSFDFAKYILQKLDVSKRLDPGCVMLIGNKQDLEHLRKVPRRNLKHLASLYGVLYQETSAANDVASVEKAFKRLLFETVSAQLLKMQTLKLSLEALEEFENTCRPLRLRRRSSNDALRQLSISSSSDDNEDNEEKNYDENAAQYSGTTSNQRRRIIQIAAFLEKIGRNHQLSKN